MQINESVEDYLERILMLQKRDGYARSVDIANELEVTKASVSRAMKLLSENGYIVLDDKKRITLTEAGAKIARPIAERHDTIAGFLMRLGVSRETAFHDACKLEHGLSEESFNAICKHAGQMSGEN